jgi:hypothetical protein
MIIHEKIEILDKKQRLFDSYAIQATKSNNSEFMLSSSLLPHFYNLTHSLMKILNQLNSCIIEIIMT